MAGDYGNTATSSPYLDPNGTTYCPDGTTCSYRIRAEFDSGAWMTPWSGWVTEGSFGTAPALNSVSYSDDGSVFYFTAPTLSSGLTVTSYDYEISTDGGTSTMGGSYAEGNTGNSFYDPMNRPGTTEIPPRRVPYLDPNGTTYCPDGTTCSYRIRAKVGDDNYQTAWSGWVTEGSFGAAPALNSVSYSDDG